MVNYGMTPRKSGPAPRKGPTDVATPMKRRAAKPEASSPKRRQMGGAPPGDSKALAAARTEGDGGGGQGSSASASPGASPSPPGPPAAAAPESPDVQLLDLWPGATVRLHGLQGRADLNGRVGTCVRWDDLTERWHVRLSGDDSVRVRPANLRDVPDEGAEAAQPPPAGARPSEADDRPSSSPNLAQGVSQASSLFSSSSSDSDGADSGAHEVAAQDKVDEGGGPTIDLDEKPGAVREAQDASDDEDEEDSEASEDGKKDGAKVRDEEKDKDTSASEKEGDAKAEGGSASEQEERAKAGEEDGGANDSEDGSNAAGGEVSSTSSSSDSDTESPGISDGCSLLDLVGTMGGPAADAKAPLPAKDGGFLAKLEQNAIDDLRQLPEGKMRALRLEELQRLTWTKAPEMDLPREKVRAALVSVARAVGGLAHAAQPPAEPDNKPSEKLAELLARPPPSTAEAEVQAPAAPAVDAGVPQHRDLRPRRSILARRKDRQASRRGGIDFKASLETVSDIESHRGEADLWHQDVGQNVSCAWCDGEFPLVGGCLLGASGRSQFAQCDFVCLTCLGGCKECGDEDSCG